MDVSNVTQATQAQVAPSVAKATGVTGTNKPVAGGNVLPGLGQIGVRLENLLSENSTTQQKDAVSASQPNAEDLRNLVNQANVVLQGRFSDLKFTVAEGADIIVVRIEDTETGELIRQFPSEAMVAISRALGEAQQGMIFEERV